jgi:diaminohydroxyphosphoribosylaminopyrimidine deaminase/5-amino-6-(5-phosphoribosylamino)uracil reductase
MNAVDLEHLWCLVRGAARRSASLSRANERAAFGIDHDGELQPASGQTAPVLEWQPGEGWTTTLPVDDDRRPFLELYLPVASATPAHPITIGHLGQSLDGFIATHAGESRFVTGEENILHLHRLRALCDAVVVGAGTVAADDPLLTTRLVPGANPIRVVIDPGRRLNEGYRMFQDSEARTLYVCHRSLMKQGEARLGTASIVGVEDEPDGPGAATALAVVDLLRARGCSRIFVEGGGVTVSMFLEANLLDRLHVAIAPLLIGDGRPAIRLSSRTILDDCQRPRYRVFRMGGDVLFDCDLSRPGDEAVKNGGPPLTRVI